MTYCKNTYIEHTQTNSTKSLVKNIFLVDVYFVKWWIFKFGALQKLLKLGNFQVLDSRVWVKLQQLYNMDKCGLIVYIYVIDKNTLSPHQGLVVEINLSESLPSPLSSLWCWIWDEWNFVEYVKMYQDFFGGKRSRKYFWGMTLENNWLDQVWKIHLCLTVGIRILCDDTADLGGITGHSASPLKSSFDFFFMEKKSMSRKSMLLITSFLLGTRKTEKVHIYALFWLN